MLLFTSSNRPWSTGGLKPATKNSFYCEKDKKWKSEGVRGSVQVTLHPVHIGQGVC